MQGNREEFGSSVAAVLALAGSAIGLGNIWRFPYIVGQHGGAAFIIVYFLFTVLLSLPVFICEATLGRNTHSNPLGAINKYAPNSKWLILAAVTIIGPMLITSYYSVVGGWSLAYLVKSCFSSFGNLSQEEVGRMFTDFSSSVWRPVIAHSAFLLCTAVVINAGVTKGIEKVSKIIMPVLFAIMVLLVIFSCTLPGAGAGLDYLLKPDFSKLNGPALAAAMGQSFFSLSLGMGTILTYGSYMKQSDNLVRAAGFTAVFDIAFALISGFFIMPAVFSVGLQPTAGPGLVFETLPYIFSNMGASSALLSKVVTIAFFLAIVLAALTSEMSMFEVCTAYLVEEKKLSRRRASIYVFGIAWAVGLFCVLFPRFFDMCDFAASNIFMTLGALGFVLFVGWKMKKAIVRDEITNNGSIKLNNKLFSVVYFLIRYVAPVGILLIFVFNFIS